MKEPVFRGLVVAVLLIIVLLPIYWMVAASLKSNLEITQQATLIVDKALYELGYELNKRRSTRMPPPSTIIAGCSPRSSSATILPIRWWSPPARLHCRSSSERLPPMPLPVSTCASISSALSDCRY